MGGLLLVSPAPLAVGQSVLLLGAVALVGVYVPLWRRQRDDAVLVQAFGAVLATGAAGAVARRGAGAAPAARGWSGSWC